MTKTYNRTNFVNFPSTDTPLNDVNMNKIDYSLNEVDNRVIELDATKADVTVVNGLIKSITLDEKTGIFTITFLNGSTQTIDTLLEKLAINFDYDAKTQKLIIELSDGSKKYIDLSELITQYEFQNSVEIGFTVSQDGKVVANLLDGAVKRSKLDPDYLAEIDRNVSAAALSERNAATSEANAKQSEINAHTSEVNALTQADRAQDLVDAAAEIMTGVRFWMGADGHLYYETENVNNTFYIGADGHLYYTVSK